MKTKRHTVAGGVVVNDAGDVLVIVRDVLRDGRMVHEVRLPKGHVDPGETIEAAAMREVGEESGYWKLRILADLGEVLSDYAYRNTRHLRTERYFLMALMDPQRGAPAPTGKEEALFEPHWLPAAEAAPQMSYPSEREFVERAMAHVESSENTTE